MTGRQSVALTVPWMRQGTAVVRAAVESLPDESFGAPSALPGWTRAHVVGHLARNAEALTRLARWAATGIEAPMYSGPEQRTADIETSARLAPAVLRHQLAATAAELDDHLARLDSRAWSADVRSALGREIPARELPWMRIREVWLHAVDLDAGVRVEALPPGVVDALVEEVAAALSKKPGCPPIDLRATDREGGWSLGAGAGTQVRGGAAGIAAWITGRSDGSDLKVDGVLPDLPAWL